MATLTTSNKLHEYFDSARHSDITILPSPCAILAHKVILAQASEYFRATFESDFREAKAPRLKPHEDEPRTINGMVAWIYGLHYDGISDFARSKPTIICTPGGFNYTTFSIDLYVTAGKYLVTGLQASIAGDMRKNLATLARTSGFSS